ncbi:hypothetical protein SRB17_27040 [Streptomyces sp. RB17]|nr:hypothetical protein [Streptomyces sp. RB17]
MLAPLNRSRHLTQELPHKGGRPAVTAAKAAAVRAAYLGGQSIAALARDHHVSRGAIRTAVADLMPEHTAADPDTPAPEVPVVLDMPGRVADFLRTTELEPAERAALDQGVTVRRGQGYTLRVSTTPEVHAGTAQGPPRVREPGHRSRSPGLTMITGLALTVVPMFPEAVYRLVPAGVKPRSRRRPPGRVGPLVTRPRPRLSAVAGGPGPPRLAARGSARGRPQCRPG